MEIKFGPAGNSISFAVAGFKKSADAPKWLSEMGLNAYEYQCGRGINIGDETASLIGKNAREHGIQMSLHTPYFINLSSIEEERMQKNVKYILDSAHVINLMGGSRMVVHCGGLSKQTRIKAMEHTKININNMLNALESDYSHVRMCIETMGKMNVLGDLDEICEIVATDDRLLPCIDFGHLNSRGMGNIKTYEDYENIFKTLENGIGVERTKILHAHFSHIEYSSAGEVRHLTFEDTIYGPKFDELAKLLAKNKYTPTIICESAGTQAEDALTMKKMYEEAQNG
ncbi:MAG: TIM barrel protein [Clostridia bacterium]